LRHVKVDPRATAHCAIVLLVDEIRGEDGEMHTFQVVSVEAAT
jgi:hypothetical protein